MVIGVDVREAAPDRRAGKGRTVHELVPRLAAASQDTWLLFTDKRFDWELPENCRWRVIPGRGLAWHRRAGRAANRSCGVFFAPTSYLTPLFLRVPTVVFVHDLVAFMKSGGGSLRNRLIERFTLRRALRRAKAVVTNSEATSQDLEKRYRSLPPVTVAPLAADPRFARGVRPAQAAAVRKRYRLPERIVLNVGTIEPRKNQAALIKAFAALSAPQRRKTGLVIAGKWGWRYGEVQRSLKDSTGVRMLGAVPDEDLEVLYSLASVFCYPSRYEGFGLPVLEAMQAGVPVIASDVPALREVGGDAVEYCDPGDTDSIKDALAGLLGSASRRRKLTLAGRRQAKRFSWEASARAVAAALGKAAR